MNTKIVDTTLRDGEQKAGLAFGVSDKIQIAKLLDKVGVYQIEAGIPAMGGDEKRSIKKIVSLGLKSKISTWNRMNIKDIKHSMDCNPDIIHITVPSSDMQIKTKFNKDREFIIENMKKCINYAVEKGFAVSVGLEDASRADFNFLQSLIQTAINEGAQRIRYADTVGIFHRERVYEEIKRLKNNFDIPLEIHAHNDLGMAVSNSISAVKAGVEFVDCTIAGIGERAGNCSLLEFMMAAKLFFGLYENSNIKMIREIERSILKIMRLVA